MGVAARVVFVVTLLSLFFSSSLQQCAPTQNYAVIPANNNKMGATNVLKLGVIGTLYANMSGLDFPGAFMRFAAERINNNSYNDLLPDTRIELVFLPNTSPDLSSNLLLTLYAIQTLGVNGLIGGLSSTESRVIQLAAKLYNISQISAHGVSAILANKEEYPYYAVTQPYDTIQISAILAQFEYFGWRRGVILYQDNDYGAGHIGLVSQGAQLGMQFLAFSIGSSASTIAEQMDAVQKQIHADRYRIIVLYLTAQATAYVMDEASKKGLVGAEYVYILSTNSAGVYTQNVIPNPRPHLKGSLSVILPTPSGPFYNQEVQAYRIVSAENATQYKPISFSNQFFFGAYDLVLTYAYAYDTLMKKGVPFADIKGHMLYSQILNTSFDGVTGPLIFSRKGDRLGYYSMTNYHATNVEFAQYSLLTNNITTKGEVFFYDNTTTIPSDGAITDKDGFICKLQDDGTVFCERAYTVRKYSKGLAGGLGAIIAFGVFVAFFAIAMLVFYWKVFITKYGTFYCAVIITGVLTSYIAAISLLPEPTDALCVVFPWFLGIAFTLVYGCLFIKAWILYRLWRYALQLKRMTITALTVVKYVGVALAVEIILLIIWTVVDPPRVQLVKMVDHTLQPQCESDTPVFWIIFLSLKAVWLIFGVVVSVLTRSVVKEYQNFTEFTYAMYNILIMVIIAVPLGILLREVPNGVMIVSVIIIVLAFLFSTIILFFNVWYSILYTDNLKLPSITSVNRSSPSPSHSGTGNSSSSRSRS